MKDFMCTGCRNDFLRKELMSLHCQGDIYYFCSWECVSEFSTKCVKPKLNEGDKK